MSNVFGVHQKFFFFLETLNMRQHKKKDKKKRERSFEFSLLDPVFWRLNIYSTQRRRLRVSERRQPTPRERERERKIHAEDAI